jgi:hypothetical protein
VNGNITLKNVTATNGNFKGVIEAAGGIRMGVKTIYASTTLAVVDSFIIINGGSDDYSVTVTLPSTPNTGQMITICNASQYDALISGNGKNIIPQQDDQNATLAYIRDGRTKQLIYSGTSWYVTGQYDY